MLLRLDTTPQNLASSRLLAANRFRFAQAVERLSSGLRINHAADDASGLFIGNKLQLQTRGWQAAQKNLQDGLSLAKVADGALGSLGTLVARIRELAVRSANGVFSDADRALMQDEVAAIRLDIDQIIQGTRFNDKQLLTGQSFRPAPTVDVSGVAGALAGSARGTDGTETGVYALVVTAPGTAAKVIGNMPAVDIPVGGGGPALDLTITSALGAVTVTLNHGDAAAGWAATIQAALDAANAGTGIGVTANYSDPGGFGANYLWFETTAVGGAQTLSVSAARVDPTLNPEDYVGFGPGASRSTGGNLQVTLNGQPATANASATTLVVTEGATGDPSQGITFQVDLTTNPPWVNATYTGLVGNVSVTAFPSQIGALQSPIQSGPDSPHEQPLDIPPMVVGAISVDDAITPNRIGTIDVGTQAGAQAAIDVADAAAVQISAARTQVGAEMNRLEYALDVAANGDVQAGNAASRVMDADVAGEAAALAQAQLLTETGVAAAAHVQLAAAASLALITDSRIAVGTGSPVVPVTVAEQPTAGGGAGGAPPSGGGGPAAPALTPVAGSGAGGPSLPGSGGFTPLPVAGSGGVPGVSLPGSGGFSPTAVLPSGFAPLPVAGSGGAAAGSMLGIGDMQSLLMAALG